MEILSLQITTLENIRAERFSKLTLVRGSNQTPSFMQMSEKPTNH